MKKGSKLAALLLGLVLVIPACNLGGNASNGASSDAAASESAVPAANYAVTISNKEQLQAEWFVGDQSRKVEIATEPKANVAQLIKDGAIQITSSNPEILSINGQMATPVAAGEATIKVKCGESEDTVALTLKAQQTIQEKYGVAHAGTAEDPLTNEEAISVAKNEKYNNEDLYVGGIISSFYHAPKSRADGACSYYLTPAEGQTEKFEVYKCYKDGTGEASYLTDDDIWVGGYAVAHGTFTVYNGTQAETTSAKFVKCEGNKPQPSTTIEATFAEALAAGAALVDGATTWDSYKFQGYVSAKSGNHFFLTATKGEALVEATSDAAHGSASYYSNAIELYNAGKVAELVAKLLEGAKVEVTMKIKNYHGTVENGYDLTDESVTVIEAGTAWSVPEPAVTDKTIAEFIALENKADKAYNVSGTIKSWKDASSAKDKYGNMVLTDGTNDLTIYGASATATALAWDNAGSYAFSNPQDFLTNELTASLAIGSEITMRLIRADYKGAIQGTGVVTGVKAVEATAIALDKTTAEVEINATVKLVATLTPANANSKVTWLSSNDTIATVADGVVTGVAAGQATITAKVSDTVKAECVVTVSAPAAAPKALPAGGLTLNAAALDLANNGTYDKNKNREVTVSGIDLVLDPDGVGTVTKASAPYTASGAIAVDCIQFKKGSLVGFRTKDRLEAAVQATVVMYTYGYATEAAKYLPTFKLGASTDAIIANETNGGTVAVAGVDTGRTYNDKGTEKVVYEYTLTYDLSALNEETLTFVTADGGAIYVGSIVISNEAAVPPQPEVAQPVGAFRGLAKTAAATFIPVDLVLAADSVALSVNGEAANVTSYTWDKVDTLTVVTDGAYGTVTAKFADNVFQITGLTGAAVSQLDLTYAVQLSGNCQFIDCGAMTLDQMNATFVRRYDRNDGNGWQINNPSDGRISAVTKEGRAGLQCNGFSSGKVGFTLKADLATPIPGTAIKSVGCWIYNPGETAIQMKLFAYKSANRATNGQLNTFTVEPGWHFYQSGVVNGSSFTSTDSFYNFQFYYENVSVNPVFDDLCIYM